MSTEFANKSRNLRSTLTSVIANIRSLRKKRVNRSLTNVELVTKLGVIKSRLFMVNRGVLSARKSFRNKIKAVKLPASAEPPANLMEHLTRDASGKFDVDVNNYPKISNMDKIVNGLKEMQNSKNRTNRAMRSAERQEVNLNDLDNLLRNAQRIGNAINGNPTNAGNLSRPRPRPRSRSVNNAGPRRSPNASELRRQLNITPVAGNRSRSA